MTVDECVHGMTAAWCAVCSADEGNAPPGGRGAARPRTRDSSDLRELLSRGLFREKEELHVWYKQVRYTATVEADGTIWVNRRYRDTPTGAAKLITDTSVNGWIFWHVASGETLADLRARL